jgi:hypothetical protein
MKQLLALAAVLCMVTGAWRTATADKSLATVQQIQGMYIFTDSTPKAEYEFLGSVKGGMFGGGNGQYQPVRDELIKQARKKYPQANGLILHFVNGDTDKADAVKFKD